MCQSMCNLSIQNWLGFHPYLIKFYKNDLSNVYGCEITLFCEIMPVTKSYFIPKVSLNPCSILKMSENKVKLMHSVYSFFLEFFRI